MSEPRILVEPGMCWGNPHLSGHRLEPWHVVGPFQAGDSLAAVCADYEITEREMEECLRWELMTPRQREKYLAGMDPFRRSDAKEQTP